MRKQIVTGLLLFATSMALCAYDLPKGWHKAGSDPKKYEMGIDKGAGENGKNVATIKSIVKHTSGFGTLMQQSTPDKYKGKRVRMTGYMKSENVAEWAGFWFRVDQAGTDERLAFDNMQNRAIKGNSDWQKYEVVLDVSEKASNIAYGALLVGTGQIWFDNINFEIVDNSVPVTGQIFATQDGPVNLDFEE